MKKSELYLIIVLALIPILAFVYVYGSNRGSLEDERIRQEIKDRQVANKEGNDLSKIVEEFIEGSKGFRLDEYQLRNLDGDIISLDGISIVNIANTNCPACRESVGVIKRLKESYEVYSVFDKNSEGEIMEYYQDAFDKSRIITNAHNERLQDMTSDLNVQFVPVFLFIKDGEVFDAFVGNANYDIFLGILSKYDI